MDDTKHAALRLYCELHGLTLHDTTLQGGYVIIRLQGSLSIWLVKSLTIDEMVAVLGEHFG